MGRILLIGATGTVGRHVASQLTATSSERRHSGRRSGKISSMKLLLTFLALAALLVDQRKQGNPLDNLPANIEVLTHFGERMYFAG